MAYILGLVGDTARHATKPSRENQPSYSYQSLSQNTDAYTNSSSPRQLPCSCLGTHLPQHPCDPYRVHEAHVPVSRRDFKRQWAQSRRAEQQTRKSKASSYQPGNSGARTTAVCAEKCSDHTESHRGVVFGGTARGLAQSSRNTATPPAYIENPRASSGENNSQYESHAPPPYEQFLADTGRRQSMEVLAGRNRDRKMP